MRTAKVFFKDEEAGLLTQHDDGTFSFAYHPSWADDSGKTAIIDAIKMVLKTHSAEWIKVEDEDFFRDADRFRIECRFKDINDDEAKYFTEWIDWVVNDKKIGEPYLTVYTTFRAGTIRLCLQTSKRELMMLAIY